MQPPATLESVLHTLDSLGVSVPAGRVVLGRYGDSASLSIELLELIRSGRKRAGTSLLWAYAFEGEPLPCVGDVEIVLDHRDRPAVEGEGDGSLAHWHRAHWSYFARECHRIAREPREGMPVVCCIFEALQVLACPA